MSISTVQKQIQLNESIKRLFSKGEKPFVDEILKDASVFFSRNPIGKPLRIDTSIIRDDIKSDSSKINELAYKVIVNLHVLYVSLYMQAAQIDSLVETLNNSVKKMDQKRKMLESKIDNYLLSIFNSDGYFYSFGEKFLSMENIDLNLTTSYVDLVSNHVSIPTIANGTKRIDPAQIVSFDVKAYEFDKTAQTVNTSNGNVNIVDRKPANFNTNSDFVNCLDNKEGTVWSGSILSDKEKSFVLELTLAFDLTNAPMQISRVETELAGSTPTQVMVKTVSTQTTNNNEIIFGNKISVGTNRLVFTDEPRDIGIMKIYMIKDQFDSVYNRSGKREFEYVIGLKNLLILQNTYDVSSIFVSDDIFPPEELGEDSFIDKVSLVADIAIPANTTAEFYISPSGGNESSIDDFSWRKIVPIVEGDSDNKVVSFDGSLTNTVMIRSNPSSYELQLIPLDDDNDSLAERNPSATIIDDANTYRIAKFDDAFLPSSIFIEEGVNSTHVIVRALNGGAISDGLSYWAEYLSNPDNQNSETYGTIDSGNGFFNGNDIYGLDSYDPEVGASVYIHTLLDSSELQPNVVRTIRKDSENDDWDVKVFLNGTQVAHLPAGEKSATIPWFLSIGLNNIIVLINIPGSSESNPQPYLGALSLMSDGDITSLGTVKLANWTYVDMFHLKYNEFGNSNTFSIFNGEIVSRKMPSDNLRLRYSQNTGFGPDAVRLRCDMSRSDQHEYVTPILQSYRLRFSYGEK